MKLPEIVLLNDLTDLGPSDLMERNTRLLGVDAENVVCDYGVAEVRPEVKDTFDELKTSVDGLTIVIITNNRDNEGLASSVSEQLEVPCFNPGMGFKKKPSADMFTEATRRFGVEPSNAAHVDDQSKAYLGLMRAGYDTFFWTLPWGEHMHAGPKRFHTWVEKPLLRPMVSGLKRLGMATIEASEVYRSDY